MTTMSRRLKSAVVGMAATLAVTLSAVGGAAAQAAEDPALDPRDEALLTDLAMPGSPMGIPSGPTGPVQAERPAGAAFRKATARVNAESVPPAAQGVGVQREALRSAGGAGGGPLHRHHHDP